MPTPAKCIVDDPQLVFLVTRQNVSIPHSCIYFAYNYSLSQKEFLLMITMFSCILDTYLMISLIFALFDIFEKYVN